MYALYPEAQISIHVAWDFRKQNTAVMIGKSIISKASKADIGELCLKFGGGGHIRAAGFSVKKPLAEAKKDVLEALGEALK